MISPRPRCEAYESVDLAWLSSGGTYDAQTQRIWTYGGDLTIAAYPEPWAVVLVIGGNSHRIPLTYKATRFGGRRPWFSCPHCHSARRVLYLGQRGFACRPCMDLRYSSQVEDDVSRISRQRRRLLERVGGDRRAAFPVKPKRMHWKTYRALEAKDQAHLKRLAVAMASAIPR